MAPPGSGKLMVSRHGGLARGAGRHAGGHVDRQIRLPQWSGATRSPRPSALARRWCSPPSSRCCSAARCRRACSASASPSTKSPKATSRSPTSRRAPTTRSATWSTLQRHGRESCGASLPSAASSPRREQARLEAVVTTRTAQLEESREQYRLIAESTNAIPFTYLPGRQAVRLRRPASAEEPGISARDAGPSRGFLESVLAPEQIDAGARPSRRRAGAEIEFECALLAHGGKSRRLRWVVNRRRIARRGRACAVSCSTSPSSASSSPICSRRRSSNPSAAWHRASRTRSTRRCSSSPTTCISCATRTGDLLRLIEALRASNQSVLDGAPSLEAAEAAVATEKGIDLAYLVDGHAEGVHRAASTA